MKNPVLLANATVPWPIKFSTKGYTTPFEFEKLDVTWWKQFMVDHPYLPWYTVGAYVVIIFSLQAYMKDKPPVKAKVSLALWNFVLAVFSLFGLIRLLQEFLPRLFYKDEDGYYGTVCVREGRLYTTDVWYIIFTLSKFIELGDTIFIVLRKAPLVLLQWFHHATVIIFSWNLAPWSESISTYTGVANFAVHTLMYSYFSVMALGIRVPTALAKCITFSQILQFVHNLYSNFYSFVMPYYGYSCPRHNQSVFWSLFINITLLFLFIKFFYEKYHGKKGKDTKQKSK